MSTYDYKPGLGLVGAYQVSGIPFVSGPIFNAADRDWETRLPKQFIFLLSS